MLDIRSGDLGCAGFRAMRGIVAIAALVFVIASCSGNGEPARSAAAFCRRYAELADAVDVSPKILAPVERASPEQIRDLADRAPNDQLDQALRDIADLQPDVLEFIDDVRTRTASEDDVDAERVERYSAAGRVLLDQRHRLCD